MSRDNSSPHTASRRTVLRNGSAIAALLGVGLAGLPGPAAAINKAELIDSIASEADITESDAKTALDAFVNATTKALKKGNRVALVGFGLFSVTKRARKAERTIHKNTRMVNFDPDPGLAAALDLIPGKGDQRRVEARNQGQNGSRAGTPGRKVDVVIDAELLASEAGKDSKETEKRQETDVKLTRADAKRALDAFIDTTTKALGEGDTVSLGEFGSFSISKRSARKGRNPQTGKEIKIPAKKIVKFKPGAELSEKIK